MLSQITYTGDGSTEVFAIPFDFIKREFVKVEVDALPVEFSWESQQAVRISPAPTSGTSITIYRKTDISKPTIEFTNSSVVSASAHNAAYRNNLHVVQEAYDALDGVAERAQASAQRAESEATEAQAMRDASTALRDECINLKSQTESARDTAVQAQNTVENTINTVGAEKLEAINTAGSSHLDAVNNAGATQVAAVNTEGAKQIDLAKAEADRATSEADRSTSEADRSKSYADSLHFVFSTTAPANPVVGMVWFKPE